MKPFKNICLIIPALNPDKKFLLLIEKLFLAGFNHIIIVNDGSTKSENTFEQIKKDKRVILLEHESNRGKGAALKTGFSYFLDSFSPEFKGIITVDADGQHDVNSVTRIANSINQNPDKVILGVREFSDDIPLRSRFGNILTKNIFKFLYKVNLKDTQTGLRGIPSSLLKDYLKINYNGYEFEMDCLIMAKKLGYLFQQVSIETIYFDDNECSHFNPILDSLRIYFVFTRFIILSAVCFILDITMFITFFNISGNVFISTYLARILSGYINFYFNKFSTFHSHDKAKFKKELFLYCLLAFFIASMSSILVNFVTTNISIPILTIKILIDSFLFLLSFIVQKKVVFKTDLVS